MGVERGEMNRLFVAYKPPFISSNRFLTQLKRKYGVKKGGFSGTLDPFAEGVLVVAFGRYTKLFPFLKKSPKIYTATLLLGGVSPTLDIEKVERIDPTSPFSKDEIRKVLKGFEGGYLQRPPLYSAKKVGGERAYRRAIRGEEVELKPVEVEIFSIELLHYSHPFLTIRAEVGEGCYIRTLGADIAERLGTTGFLTYLKREQEGSFSYRCEEPLNPIEHLNLPPLHYLGSWEWVKLGKRLTPQWFKNRDGTPPFEGRYYITNGEILTLLEVKGDRVYYLLNNLPLPS
jgi:tRNA pseudouridine55 synthase